MGRNPVAKPQKTCKFVYIFVYILRGRNLAKMNNIIYMTETLQTPVDMNFKDFVSFVFGFPPQDAFSYDFSFIENIPSREQQAQLLGEFLVTGAKLKYNKALADLSDTERQVLRQYLLSIGFDVNYIVKPETKTVIDYTINNE